MMAKNNIEQKLFFREKDFNIDKSGYFSGEITYELHGIASSGTVINAFIEFQRDGKVCLISEITRCFLSETNNVLTVYASGQIDGSALPDSYKLHYRLNRPIDCIRAEPDLPGNIGSALLNASPKNLIGRSKWNSSGGNKITSILVHNKDGQFSVSSAIELGKKWAETNVVVRYNGDDYSTYLFDDYQSQKMFLNEHYVEGSETLVCEFFFFEAAKWLELPSINEFDIQRRN